MEPAKGSVTVIALVKTKAVTGVEMEALSAASTAALAIYDTIKAVVPQAVITDIKVLEKPVENLKTGSLIIRGSSHRNDVKNVCNDHRPIVNGSGEATIINYRPTGRGTW